MTAVAGAAASYSGEAVIVEQMETTYRYNPDGTGTRDFHVVARIQNDAGAQQMQVVTATFAADTQTAQVERLSVRHADGTTTVTPPGDAMKLPAQVTQEAPLYSDLTVLQIPVRGLRAGDMLEYRIRITQTRPEASNEFWDNYSFLKKGVVARSEAMTLDVPANVYVQVWSPKYKAVKTQEGGRVVYRWTTSQLEPSSGDGGKDATATTAASTNPDVAWTTFRSWKQVGDWYRGLAAPQAVPTDALRAQAEQVTQGAKTPEDQVKAIYAFVSGRIRYIGVYFGIGRFEPHPAAEVLASQFGDCKDKDTLLEALLRARGFTTAPALIGVGIDMIPELPGPQMFNHVITTVELPSGRIWLDSTAEVAPFQYLLPTLRDKQALVMPASGDAGLERTPAGTPYPFVDRLTTKGTLKTDGEMNAHVVMEDRSDAELVLRALAKNLAPAQWNQGMQYLVQLLGFSGIASNSTFGQADDFSGPMRVSYDYRKKPYGDWDHMRILPLFPVINLPAEPDKEPASDLDLGSPRTEVAVTEMQLPAGYGAVLPDAVHVKTPFATFNQTYDLEKGVLMIQRTVVVLQAKLPAASWQAYQKFAKDSSLRDLTFIQLTAPGSTSGVLLGGVDGNQGSPSAAGLVAEAVQLERSKTWTAAREKLDQAKALEPKQPYLWSNYAYIALSGHNMDEAEEDFAKEIELHPEESTVALAYANLLHFRHKSSEARNVLSAAFHQDPMKTQVALALAEYQAEDDLPDAIATLKTALAASPKNPLLDDAMALYLMLNKQPRDAAPYALQALDMAQGPEDLNNASYLLAEAESDLPVAEQKSRQSLDLLDTETSQEPIGSMNQNSFRQAMLLTESWDTLGYILLQENRLKEAQRYLEASWHNEPVVTIGLHYGEVLERLGEKEEALRIFQMSQGERTLQNAEVASDQRELEKDVERMKAEGVRSLVKDPKMDLQNERVFHFAVADPYKTFVSGTFRLQIDSSGVHDAMQVSGDDSLGKITDAIRKMKLPHLVPEDSKALMLRDVEVACEAGARSCQFVLIPMGGIGVEQVK